MFVSARVLPLCVYVDYGTDRCVEHDDNGNTRLKFLPAFVPQKCIKGIVLGNILG